MTTWGIFWVSFFSCIAFVVLCTLLEEVNNHLYQRFRAKFYEKEKEQNNE